jgi:hypothetical protein
LGRSGGPGRESPDPTYPAHQTHPAHLTPGSQGWDRDAGDVALADGMVCRIFRDRATDGWFIDAVVD